MGSSNISKFDINGNYMGVTINDIDEASSINIQYLNNGEERLLVSDWGKSQQIYGYIGLNNTNNVLFVLINEIFV